jgi:hypothetical protein
MMILALSFIRSILPSSLSPVIPEFEPSEAVKACGWAVRFCGLVFGLPYIGLYFLYFSLLLSESERPG